MVGWIVALLYAIGPGALTNWMLRDRLGWKRIVLAILAGIGTGLLVLMPLCAAIEYFSGFLHWTDALVGIVLGPVAAAVAAQRHRPRKLPDGDMRAGNL